MSKCSKILKWPYFSLLKYHCNHTISFNPASKLIVARLENWCVNHYYPLCQCLMFGQSSHKKKKHWHTIKLMQVLKCQAITFDHTWNFPKTGDSPKRLYYSGTSCVCRCLCVCVCVCMHLCLFLCVSVGLYLSLSPFCSSSESWSMHLQLTTYLLCAPCILFIITQE